MFNEAAEAAAEPNYVDLLIPLRKGKPYVFPARFCGLESKDQLVVELKLCAIKAGFNLSVHSSRNEKALGALSQYGHSVVFGCQQSRLQQNTRRNTRLKQQTSSVNPDSVSIQERRGRLPTKLPKSTKPKHRFGTKPPATKTGNCQRTRSLLPAHEADRCRFGFTAHMLISTSNENPLRWILVHRGRHGGKWFHN